MKKLSLYLILAISLFAFNPLWAGETETENETVFPNQITEVLAETCPVMGGKINQDVYTIVDGKLYYFCCPGCIGMFRKNPDKYLNKIKDATTQKLQVTNTDGKCPISAKKASLEFFIIDEKENTITFYHDKSSLQQAEK